MDINLPTCWRSDIGRAPHGWRVGSGALTSTGSLPSGSTREWRQSSQIHVDWLRHGTVERRLAMLYWPTCNISTLSNSHSGFQLFCWATIPRLSRRPKTFLPGRSVVHMRYWTYCTWCHPRPTHLTKCTVYKDARCIMYGMPNISKFIATLFQ